MADAFSIRRARPDEADRLTEIAFAAKRYWGYPEAWLDAWRDALTFTSAFVASHEVFVAQDAADVVVACYALVEDSLEARLEHLWVEPHYIGRGLGRMLLDHAAATVRARGGTSLIIDADPNAEAFYVRMGAQRVGAVRADLLGARRELPRLRLALRAM